MLGLELWGFRLRRLFRTRNERLWRVLRRICRGERRRFIFNVRLIRESKKVNGYFERYLFRLKFSLGWLIDEDLVGNLFSFRDFVIVFD